MRGHPELDASIPNNGFRRADKWEGEWDRTCLDYLEAGDIFRLVNQDGTVKDGKLLRVVEPLEMAVVRDWSSVDPHAKKRAYLGGKMVFESVEDQQEIKGLEDHND